MQTTSLSDSNHGANLPLTAIEKKRRFAQERADRLKDPRIRQMGIDKQALDDQVKEKQLIHKMEKDRDDYFNNQSLLMDRHAQVLQREADEIRMNRERGTNDYRHTFQKRENRREWDLNDPKRFLKDIPARVGDDDPRVGVSSLQKLEGEDLDRRTRVIAQAKQQREWARQQTDEKIMKKWMEQDANRTYEDRSEEMAFKTWQLAQNVAEQRAQAAKTTSDFNKNLADQKREEAAQERMRDSQGKMEEVYNMLTSDMLNETESLMSAAGEAKKAERFKGFSKEQLERIEIEQANQREEMRLKQIKEAEDERQISMADLLDNRMAVALDKQRRRETAESNRHLASERLQQNVEAIENKRKLDELYTNAVGEEYFKPFGQCGR